MKPLLPSIIFIIMSLSILTGCNHNQYNVAIFELDGKPVQAIYEKAEKEFKDKDYGAAINTYVALYSLYPFSHHAASARLKIIRCYYKQAKMEEVIQTADKFIQRYPHHQEVDMALYLKGKAYLYKNFNSTLRTLTKYKIIQQWLQVDLAQLDVSTLSQAKQCFMEFSKFFPNSIYKAKVDKKMEELQNLLAGHEYNIATYYFEKKAYLAAFKRASEVIDQYPETHLLSKAKALKQKAAEKLGINDITAQQ